MFCPSSPTGEVVGGRPSRSQSVARGVFSREMTLIRSTTENPPPSGPKSKYN
jgi:hypothetical protein